VRTTIGRRRIRVYPPCVEKEQAKIGHVAELTSVLVRRGSCSARIASLTPGRVQHGRDQRPDVVHAHAGRAEMIREEVSRGGAICAASIGTGPHGNATCPGEIILVPCPAVGEGY